MTTLDQILAATRERVARAKQRAQVRPLEKAAAAHTPRGFRKRLAAMAQLGPAVIGELKKASPSKGTIRGTFPVGVLANQLALGGASALSVLTDEEFFQGSLANLLEASAATELPCLRKDFIIDEFQITEARAHESGGNGKHFAHSWTTLWPLVANYDHIAGFDLATLDSRECLLLTVEDSCRSLVMLKVVTGDLEHTTFGSKIPFQNHKSSGWFKRTVRRTDNFLIGCLHCSPGLFSDRLAGYSQGIGMQ